MSPPMGDPVAQRVIVVHKKTFIYLLPPALVEVESNTIKKRTKQYFI